MTNRITTVVEYQVTKAIKALQDTQKELGQTEISGDQLAEALSKAAAESKAELDRISAASEAMAAALGDEFVQARAEAGVSVDSIVMELNRLGVSFDEIAAHSDKLAVSVRDLEAVQKPVGGLGQSARSASGDLDKLTNSGDQSRSVLANLVGNASQDLGQFGGIAGTAGVALGQLAEYAVDGNIALANLAKFAGPLAVIGGLTAVVASNLQNAAEAEAFRAERVDAFTAALREGVTAAEAWNAALDIDNQEAVEFVDATTGKVADLTPVLAEAGVTYEEFIAQVEGGRDAFNDWAAAVFAGTEGSDQFNKVLQAGWELMELQATATQRAAQQAEVFAESAGNGWRATERWGDVSRSTAGDIEDMYESMGEAAQEEIAATQARLQGWLNQLDKIPDEKRTEIQAAIDAGQIGAAERLLNSLARTRFAAIFPVIQPATTSKGAAAIGTGNKAISTVNDQVRNLQRAVGAFNSTLDGLGSGGGGGGGGGAASPAESEAEKWDDAIEKLHEYGQFTRDEYMTYLREQIAGEELLSDRRLSLARKLATFEDEIAREQERAAKEAEEAAKRAAEEAERLAKEKAAAEELALDLAYEYGEISEQQYRSSLEARLASLDRYSQEYATIWRKIRGIDDRNAQEEKRRAEEVQRAAEEAKRAQDEELQRAANRAITAANIRGATYQSINTGADPQSVIRAIQQYERSNGKGWRQS